MDDMDALLAAYADGELDPAGIEKVEAWIAATPTARDTLAIHRETTALLRAAFAEALFATPAIRLPPPVGLAPARLAPAGLAAAGLPAARVPLGRARVRRFVWAAAASVFLTAAGYSAGVFWPDLLVSERDRMLTEVAEYHAVFSRETVHLVEVPAAQADHLKAWLGKRVNRTLVIPDFKAAGLTFAGGRMVVVDGAPVAELMYTRESGLPIAFCVFHRAGKPGDVQEARRGAVNLATWDDGSHSYVIVGEAAPGIIRELAMLARKQI